MSQLSDEKQNLLCVGIDLGTTNSVLAIINEKPNGNIVSKVVDISRATEMFNTLNGEAKLAAMKKPLLPSYIYYRQEKNYQPLVGDFAKGQYPIRPYLVAKSIKSQMGNPVVTGLSPDIPDQNPAQVASRILQHLLGETRKICRCKPITNAVITVPASFDPAMRKATLDAAELAGIQVKNPDGTERPILLSEPNAVIYDLINQMQNGEIADHILDLKEKKRVLVFDLGGGTLDITLHEIKRGEENADILKVDDIAINRYTLLGGDDFDEAIANSMYEKYLMQYKTHPEVIAELKQKKEVIMSQFRVKAEILKLDLNARFGDEYSYASNWDDEDEDPKFPVGGNMGGICYAYDANYTKEEVEEILSDFLAYHLKYDDYKELEHITQMKNIIYPILEVLRKAADKLGVKDIKVDEVIVNGGMSKFYMIKERLTEFFGFEPIVALDPDQAVARGAAVYHYYLRKNNLLSDYTDDSIEHQAKRQDNVSQANVYFKPGRPILNDSLYLGVKNGAVHKIIPTGAELPYTSSIMTGFKIEPRQNKIEIPIKSQNADGSYRKIANGNISFKQMYNKETYVAFSIYMNSNKIITMKAWTSEDIEGKIKIEEGYTEIAIDNNEEIKGRARLLPPSGSILNPQAEINHLRQLYNNYEKSKTRAQKNMIVTRISNIVANICNAGNKEAFAPLVIENLTNKSEYLKQRLFIIARKIGTTWNDVERKQLASLCMKQLDSELNGLLIGGQKVCTNIQAIFTLSMCGNSNQLAALEPLHSSQQYLQSCLYTHAKTKTALDWIIKEFEKDIQLATQNLKNNLQFSAYAVGISLQNNNSTRLTKIKTKIVNLLCKIIKSTNLTNAELISCTLALGWICDQRNHKSDLDETVVQEALYLLQTIEDYYVIDLINESINFNRPREIALKMIQGESLNREEEEFLLTKIEQ